MLLLSKAVIVAQVIVQNRRKGGTRLIARWLSVWRSMIQAFIALKRKVNKRIWCHISFRGSYQSLLLDKPALVDLLP